MLFSNHSSLIEKDSEKNIPVYFKNLDALRFLGAFMVVIAHGCEGWIGWIGFPPILRAHTEDIHTPNSIGEWINQIILNFSFGVDIFFLISGFLITYLLLKEKEKFGKISIKNFMIRRSLRIWPLYFLIVITAPFIVQLSNDIKPEWITETPDPNYIKYYFFLGNYDIISTEKWMFPLAHFWSICIEEHFYLVWPFIIAFIPNRYLIKICLAIILINLAVRGYYYNTDLSHSYTQSYLNTICRVDVIIIGAIFAYIHYQKPMVLSSPKILRILLLIGFILTIGSVSIYGSFSLLQVLFKKYIFVMWAGFLMLNFIFNKQPLISFKRKGIVNYLGKISFGIYIYHNILLQFVIEDVVFKYSPERIVLWKYFVIYIGATILMSIISWELFEKRILKFKTRFEAIRTSR